MNKIIITIITSLLLITGCTNKQNQEALNEQLNTLYTQENNIFSSNQDLWNKVFSFVEKYIVESTDYVTFLKTTINNNIDNFTSDELTILNKDIEKISEIEKEILSIQSQLSETNISSNNNQGAFPEFSGKDLDGNIVDSTIFSKNKVTIINFWFNGCKPCIEELSNLDKLNNEIKELGGEVIGVNTELSENETLIDETKEILKTQNAHYKNIYFDKNSKAYDYTRNILGYPTTILVDNKGNIIGEQFLGNIDNEIDYNKLLDNILNALNIDKG